MRIENGGLVFRISLNWDRFMFVNLGNLNIGRVIFVVLFGRVFGKL